MPSHLMRPRRAVPQTPQASFASIPVTILQTHDSSNPFKINTYKTTSQLLILNHLLQNLNPLDATFTQKPGGRGSTLVSRESCMSVEIVTSHLSPLLSISCALFARRRPRNSFAINRFRTLSRATEGVAPLTSLLLYFLYFLTSLLPYLLTSSPSRLRVVS